MFLLFPPDGSGAAGPSLAAQQPSPSLPLSRAGVRFQVPFIVSSPLGEAERFMYLFI